MYKCYKVNKNINGIEPNMVVEWQLIPPLLELQPSKNTSPDLVTNLAFPSENPRDKEKLQSGHKLSINFIYTN